MKTNNSSLRHGVVALACLASAFACIGTARADPGTDEGMTSGASPFSLGGRAMYNKPLGANAGTWSGGAQARLHLGGVVAVEGAVDYRQQRFGTGVADIYPVQVSLLLYLLPHSPVSPYILGGGGWYYTHVRAPVESTQNRFGPHAGAGLEVFLSRSVSIDGDYRYLWNEDVHSQDEDHPLGRNFSDKGHMITIGLNFRF